VTVAVESGFKYLAGDLYAVTPRLTESADAR